MLIPHSDFRADEDTKVGRTTFCFTREVKIEIQTENGQDERGVGYISPKLKMNREHCNHNLTFKKYVLVLVLVLLTKSQTIS